MTPDKTIIACTRPASRSNTLLERGPLGARREWWWGEQPAHRGQQSRILHPSGPPAMAFSSQLPLGTLCVAWFPSLFLDPAVSGNLSPQPLATFPLCVRTHKAFPQTAVLSVGLQHVGTQRGPTDPQLGRRQGDWPRCGLTEDLRFVDTNPPCISLHLSTSAFSRAQARAASGDGVGWLGKAGLGTQTHRKTG